MNRFALVAVVVVVVGCGKKKPQEGIEPPPMAPAGSGSAAPAPKPLTGEEVAKHFDACWDMWNAGKYDDFKGCYTADATRDVPGSGAPVASGAAAAVESTKLLKSGMPDLKGEAVLELVDGHNLVAVMLVSGTHTAPLKTPMGDVPATNKKTGFLVAQAIEVTDAGSAKTEADYFDLLTVLGQLTPNPKHPVRPAMDKVPAPKQVIVAKHDDTEKANLETVKQSIDAWNKHDAKAFGALLADDLVFSDVGDPKDAKKAELLASLPLTWKGMSDAKVTTTSIWSAGRYVVVVGAQTGTNDGPMLPEIPKPTKKVVSIPALWVLEVDKGKIKALMGYAQTLAMMTQLGLVPATPAPAKP